MSWLASLWLAIKRERNRRKRWAYRNRVTYTWQDPRPSQRNFEGWQRRMRQS